MARLRPARTQRLTKEADMYSLFERFRSAASGVVFTSSRRGCCSECRWMSPLASPIERSRTPGNTDTAIFELAQRDSSTQQRATSNRAHNQGPTHYCLLAATPLTPLHLVTTYKKSKSKKRNLPLFTTKCSLRCHVKE